MSANGGLTAKDAKDAKAWGALPEDRLSRLIIRSALIVHSELGAGLLESAYETCLFAELIEQGLAVERQVALPVRYKGRELNCGFRLDLLVEGLVIVELKAVGCLADVHRAQALTYLKLSQKRLCLLLNFNVPHLRRGGIERLVLNLK